jgi:hypothetical protein
MSSWGQKTASQHLRAADRQLQVLHWIADGCPDGQWPDETHKLTARALVNLGLVRISRPRRDGRKTWHAVLTPEGARMISGQPVRLS